MKTRKSAQALRAAIIKAIPKKTPFTGADLRRAYRTLRQRFGEEFEGYGIRLIRDMWMDELVKRGAEA